MLSNDDISFYESKRSSDVDLSSPELRAELSNFLQGGCQWLLARYNGLRQIVPHTNGNTLAQMKPLLTADDIYYGVFAIYYQGLRRHAFFSFIGANVAGMKRAKVSMHRSALSNYYEGSVCHFAWEQEAEVTVESILRTMQTVGLDPSLVTLEFSDFTSASNPAVLISARRLTRPKFNELDWLTSGDTFTAEPAVESNSTGFITFKRLLVKYEHATIPEKNLLLATAAAIKVDSQVDMASQLDMTGSEYSTPITRMFGFDAFYDENQYPDITKVNSFGDIHEIELLHPAECLLYLLGLRLFLKTSEDVTSFLDKEGSPHLFRLWNEIKLLALCHDGSKTLSKVLCIQCIGRIVSHFLKERDSLPTKTKAITSLNDPMKSKVIEPAEPPESTLHVTNQCYVVLDQGRPAINPIASLLKSNSKSVDAITPSLMDSERYVNQIVTPSRSERSSNAIQPNDDTSNVGLDASAATDEKKSNLSPVAALLKDKLARSLNVNNPNSTVPSSAEPEKNSISSNPKVNPIAALLQERSKVMSEKGPDSTSPSAVENDSRGREVAENPSNIDSKGTVLVNPLAAMLAAKSKVLKTQSTSNQDSNSDSNGAIYQRGTNKTENELKGEDSASRGKTINVGIPINPVAAMLQARSNNDKKKPPSAEAKNCNTNDENKHAQPAESVDNKGYELPPEYDSESLANSKSIAASIQQIRRCYWEVLDDCSGTVFDSMVVNEFNISSSREIRDIDMPLEMSHNFFEEVKKVFTKEIVLRELTEEERIGQAVGAIGGKLGKGSLTFLDQRRFNNIAIKLRQMNKSNSFIRHAVLTLDEDFLVMERVCALLECAPTGDDMESIAPYDGDPDLLAVCERFFYDVQDVPLFTKRIEAMKARLDFNIEVEYLLNDLGDLTLAVLSIAQSKALLVFINMALQVGNFLNQNTSRAGAVGFDISFLPKLSYIKSGDLKTNMMRFILDNFDSNPKTVGLIDVLLEDLEPCVEASKISLHRIETALNGLKKRLNVIKIICTSVSNRNKKGKLGNDLFGEKMSGFLKSSDTVLNKLISPIATELNSTCNGLLRYYGVVQSGESGEAKSNTFFSIFRDLISSIQVARQLSKVEVEKIHTKQLKLDALQNAVNARNASKVRHSTAARAAAVNADIVADVEVKVKSQQRLVELVKGHETKKRFVDEILEIREKMKNRKPRVSHDFDLPSSGDAAPSVIGDSIVLKRHSLTERNDNFPSISSANCYVGELAVGELVVSARCVELWQQMHQGDHINWFAMTLDHTSGRLELQAYGTGGMHEMIMKEESEDIESANLPWIHNADALATDNQSSRKPYVVCFRVVGIDDTSRRFKFVAVYFNHPDLTMRVRAHLSQLKRHVQAFLTGIHVEFSVESSLFEITEQNVVRKLLASGGAHAPRRFEF